MQDVAQDPVHGTWLLSQLQASAIAISARYSLTTAALPAAIPDAGTPGGHVHAAIEHVEVRDRPGRRYTVR